MILYQHERLKIYFGDARQNYIPATFASDQTKNLTSFFPFLHPAQLMQAHQFFFLQQVHGNDGLYLDFDRCQTMLSFSHPGDFLITQEPYLGLGISTADCLPLIMYDSKNHVIASVHAGWRGTIAGIAISAYHNLISNFNSQATALKIFFGPSAKTCCYSVSQEVQERAKKYSYYNDAFQAQDNQIFFDLPKLNKLQLQECGVPSHAFYTMYNVCTICNLNFCSYRRQPASSARQMTIALLT